MNRNCTYFLLLLLIFTGFSASAQDERVRPNRQLGNLPPTANARDLLNATRSRGADSLERRNNLEDSITLTYRLLDSSRIYTLDSSLNDFTKRLPLPAHYMYLGNLGNAAQSLIFRPMMKPGWDHGFHVFDIYAFKPQESRFFNTTRPYSEVSYMMGSKQEQMIQLLHTQNIRPNWNFAFQYHMVNAPGAFRGQKANHNNYRFNSHYQSKNKRYAAYLNIVSNKLQSSENGGIDDETRLKDPNFKNRQLVPTLLGGDAAFSGNFFSTDISTGNRHVYTMLSLRQQYDLGKKDSLVRDSSTIKLFYPKLRIQHTVSYNQYEFEFIDKNPNPNYYRFYYGLSLPVNYLSVKDAWQELNNEVAVYQFPDSKNPYQFFKAGANFQVLNGELEGGVQRYYNIAVSGEYRNKTRNQKWDIEANGQFYVNGLNAGDYGINASLKRFLGKKIGYFEVGFQNVNRSPSFNFDPLSHYTWGARQSLNKENNTHIYASAHNPLLRLGVSAHYYLLSNYTYLRNFYGVAQEATIFNVLQIEVNREFRWRKRWHWYANITLQQPTAEAPVRFPLLFTRNRFVYEGNFFKNLFLATGVEIRYNSPFKADYYSPAMGRFYLGNTTISNAPDVAAFLHFRIRRFNAYSRFENLNTINFSNGFGFTNNNIASTGYPYHGFIFRLGIFWGFVN